MIVPASYAAAPGIRYQCTPFIPSPDAAPDPEYDPDADPDVAQTFGIFGDIGDTANSSDVRDHLLAANPDVILNTGDFTYAGEMPARAFPAQVSSAQHS